MSCLKKDLINAFRISILYVELRKWKSYFLKSCWYNNNDGIHKFKHKIFINSFVFHETYLNSKHRKKNSNFQNIPFYLCASIIWEKSKNFYNFCDMFLFKCGSSKNKTMKNELFLLTFFKSKTNVFLSLDIQHFPYLPIIPYYKTNSKYYFVFSQFYLRRVKKYLFQEMYVLCISTFEEQILLYF